MLSERILIEWEVLFIQIRRRGSSKRDVNAPVKTFLIFVPIEYFSRELTDSSHVKLTKVIRSLTHFSREENARLGD